MTSLSASGRFIANRDPVQQGPYFEYDQTPVVVADNQLGGIRGPVSFENDLDEAVLEPTLRRFEPLKAEVRIEVVAAREVALERVL